MQSQKKRIILNKLDDMIYLEGLSCVHVGNINFNEEKFLKRIDVIKNDPNRYWIGMGDYADSITAGAGMTADKRLNYLTIDRKFLTGDEQYDYIQDKFAPIKSKCLGLHEGNHDYALEEKTGHQYVRNIAKQLGIPYLGYASFTLLEFVYKGKVIRNSVVLSGHGHYNGGKPGGNLNWMLGLAGEFEADVYITAHSHNIISYKKMSVGVDNDGHIVKYPKVFVSTGTFLESYVENNLNYAEKGLMGAKKVGNCTVGFVPSTGSIYTFE